jgi:RecA/RadA recombinase
MAKEKTQYVCNACGATSPRWLGKCPSCGAWNSLIESVSESASGGKNRLSAPQGYAGLANAQPVTPLSAIEATDVARTPSGIDELDRVLGGGIVEGGVVLIGGDPGIGKSTLLLQALDALHRKGLPTLYVTGEESGAQIALRSRRLGLDNSQVQVLAEIQLEKILATLEANQPAVVVIDSIQTVYSDQLSSAPGSVAQVRECAAHLTRAAKTTGICVVLIGHVTKEGALALGTTAMVKPSFAASLSRSWPRGAGRTSPASPTSPNAKKPRGSALPRKLEVIANITAKSAAGSLMRTPPTALTNTSWSAQATPAWRLSTASSIAMRSLSRPTESRRGLGPP